ncbi:RNA polymerase sigma factor [Novosphingobium sp. AP12]|uniref:RNA polymerase sigma factor n=1 Tax=Novosphingobium sp. AP12 TaxID=1144305 RepID=UPI000271F1B7|nr:RNA polymerase sigma factor [Novosphingobium sp. AP12]EJL24230.1 RNA polymerase sigma factor, sigma-70 family [Novosphingobium sp. AP12]
MIVPAADQTDAELAERALAGQEAAFAQLMRRHRSTVYRVACSHVADATQALDITQETFISAFAALDRYDRSRPFRLWIARIAINKCHDWGRRRAVRRLFAFALPIDEAATVADADPSPEEVVGARAELARVNAAIAALPANLKDVLILRAIEDLSQAEAARVLGISEKAVETRLYRARNKLNQLLRDGGGTRV